MQVKYKQKTRTYTKKNSTFIFLNEATSPNRSIYALKGENQGEVIYSHSKLAQTFLIVIFPPPNEKLAFNVFDLLLIFLTQNINADDLLPNHTPMSLSEWMSYSITILPGLPASPEPMKYTWNGFVPPANEKVR